MATINGHFDLAKFLLDQRRGSEARRRERRDAALRRAQLRVGAEGQLSAAAGVQQQQQTTYLELMTALLDKGADPNARLRKKVWYSGYNSDLSGVDETGATPFWRAAYASDVDAMRLLLAHGADPNIPTMKPAGRRRLATIAGREVKDVSGLPPVPVGGPSVTPLHGGDRRRLRRRVRGQLAQHPPGGLDAGGEVSSSRSSAPTSTRRITRATPRCTMPPPAATSR